MSIDLIDKTSSSRRLKFQRSTVESAIGKQGSLPINNLIILFGGWGSANAGQPIDYKKTGTGTQKLAKAVSTIKPAPNQSNKLLAYEGSHHGGASDALLNEITKNFHPLGKLIVYGFSAGGLTALQLSYRLGMVFPYYDTKSAGFSKYFPSPNTRQPGATYGFVRIDLLFTVDVAFGPQSSITPRRIWPSVRRNVNVYQTHPSPVRSHGGPTEIVDDTATDVPVQYDWTSKYTDDPSSAHGKIDDDSIDMALSEITAELST